MKLLTSFRGSYSRNHDCQSPSPTIKLTRTGSRASLSAWSALCGGSLIGLALPRNDLTKRPRLLRVPKRVVLSEYMDSWRNQGCPQLRLTDFRLAPPPLRPTDVVM